MVLKYDLSEKICLDFLTSNILKTRQAKKYIRQFSILYLFFIVFLFLNYSLTVSIFLSVIIICVILSLKKIFLISFKKKFRNPSIRNSNIIFFNKLILNLSNNLVNIKSEYENVSIPFDKIKYIYISDEYIFIINKISKDILIPINILDSISDKNEFLNFFTDKNIIVTTTFPDDYSFVY